MKKKKQKKRGLYTEGQINKIIDTVLHPCYESSEWFRVIDGLIHGLNEKDAMVSARKFAKYNLAAILKKILEEA